MYKNNNQTHAHSCQLARAERMHLRRVCGGDGVVGDFNAFGQMGKHYINVLKCNRLNILMKFHTYTRIVCIHWILRLLYGHDSERFKYGNNNNNNNNHSNMWK